jgi:hypothetical protein
MKSQQIVDQTAKGGILGLVGYFLLEVGVDAGIVAALLPLLAAILAWASGRVGDQAIASFLGSGTIRGAVKSAVKAVDREVKQAEAASEKKTAVKKTMAKKPVAKKPAKKKPQ